MVLVLRHGTPAWCPLAPSYLRLTGRSQPVGHRHRCPWASNSCGVTRPQRGAYQSPVKKPSRWRHGCQLCSCTQATTRRLAVVVILRDEWSVVTAGRYSTSYCSTSYMCRGRDGSEGIRVLRLTAKVALCGGLGAGPSNKKRCPLPVRRSRLWGGGGQHFLFIWLPSSLVVTTLGYFGVI